MEYIFKMLDKVSRLSPLKPHRNPYVLYGFLLGFARGLESPAPRTLPEDLSLIHISEPTRPY